MVLAKLKADAEAYLGEAVTNFATTSRRISTIPSRQATKDAGPVRGFLRRSADHQRADRTTGRQKEKRDHFWSLTLAAVLSMCPSWRSAKV